MFKKTVLFVIVLVAVATLFMCKSDKKTVLIRLVVPTPANDFPLTVVNDDLAERFNERADGEYKIEVHAGGALAKLPEYFDALRTGTVEMALAPWGFYSFMESKLGIIETPFLLNNQKAGAYTTEKLLPLYDQILQEKFNPESAFLKKDKIKVIAIHPGWFSSDMGGKEAPITPSDAAGHVTETILKDWKINDPIYVDPEGKELNW